MRRNVYIVTTLHRFSRVEFHYTQAPRGLQGCEYRERGQKCCERLEADDVGGALMCTTRADVGGTPWRSPRKLSYA